MTVCDLILSPIKYYSKNNWDLLHNIKIYAFSPSKRKYSVASMLRSYAIGRRSRQYLRDCFILTNPCLLSSFCSITVSVLFSLIFIIQNQQCIQLNNKTSTCTFTTYVLGIGSRRVCHHTATPAGVRDVFLPTKHKSTKFLSLSMRT